ncbi:MAG: hypothetical protein AAF494_01805 [Pseudomonadota bacterium]
MSKPEPLSGVLREIEAVAGREAALTIARKLGGTRVYFPAQPGADHWLSQLLGHDAALAIGEQLTGGFAGGARIDIPCGRFGHAETARAKVDSMIRQGATERDIALATRYTTRGIRKRKAKLRDGSQMDLFKT